MELRSYQINAIEDVKRAFERHDSVLLQMPTGTGKTNVFCEIIKSFLKNHSNKRILILVHRKELIQQIFERLQLFSLTSSQIGKINADSDFNPNIRIHIASIQTLIRRPKNDLLANNSLVVIDEAHHTPATTYVHLLDLYKTKQAKLLGVTATPSRLDGKSFQDLFQTLIVTGSLNDFIPEFLSPLKHFASNIVNLNLIKLRLDNKGVMDYDQQSLQNLYAHEVVMADIIESYKNHGENKKSIVFAICISQAINLRDRFEEAGFKAEVVTSKTSASDREKILVDFKNGKTKILVNVDIFSEGFDCPDVEVVQIAKPTKSLVRYLQMIGRVTRNAPNKKYGIILDNACLWIDHGLATWDRIWTLEGSAVKQKNFEGLIFDDGSTGEDTYERKLRENKLIDLILIEDVKKIEKREIQFTRTRLSNLCRRDLKISTDMAIQYFEDSNFDFVKHLDPSASKFLNRFVSEELIEVLFAKFCPTENEG